MKSLTQCAIVYTLVLLTLGFAVPSSIAKDDGYFDLNYTKSLPSCNKCHKNATTNGAVSVSLTGPQSLTKGKVGPFALPLSLTAFGAPGCELNVSIDIATPIATTGSGTGNGTGSISYPIPNDASLRSVKIYLSTLVVDRGANKFGFTNPNGLEAVIQ